MVELKSAFAISIMAVAGAVLSAAQAPAAAASLTLHPARRLSMLPTCT